MSANAPHTIAPPRRAAESRNAHAGNGRDAHAADGSTFAPALTLLPCALRGDIERFYRVLRTIDDLVDDDDPRAEQRVAALERWAAGEGDERFAGGGACTTETRILDELAARRPLPRARLLPFCAGMRHDLVRGVIETDEDFDVYCYQAGGSVGIALAHLLGAEGIDATGSAAEAPPAWSAWRSREQAPRQEALSDAEAGMETLGRAMQVTNIIRDIDEDLHHRRLYIASSMIERHGFPAPGRREALLRELIERADALYEQGAIAIPLLGDGAAAMALASALYREILRQIERDGFGAKPGRAVVCASRTAELIAAHEARRGCCA